MSSTWGYQSVVACRPILQNPLAFDSKQLPMADPDIAFDSQQLQIIDPRIASAGSWAVPFLHYWLHGCVRYAPQAEAFERVPSRIPHQARCNPFPSGLSCWWNAAGYFQFVYVPLCSLDLSLCSPRLIFEWYPWALGNWVPGVTLSWWGYCSRTRIVTARTLC